MGSEPKVVRSDAEWREVLDPVRYAVLREAATERPWTSPYNVEHREGRYLCGGCGAELFRSEAKFESHCGWPSFTEPADGGAVELREDRTHGMVRTEVLCSRCGGHLGHVFDDGPSDRGGQRYCINGVAIDLEPVEG